jgi:hypothetical protein
MDDEKQTLNSFLDAFYNLSPDKKYELISSLNIDFSSIQHFLENVQRALDRVSNPLSQFAANFSLERGLRGTILKAAEDRLQSGKLNEDDVRHLTEHRDEFQSRFDSLMGGSDNPGRTDILFAILSAFAIGLHGEVSESILHL